jgi:hypothetical protein
MFESKYYFPFCLPVRMQENETHLYSHIGKHEKIKINSRFRTLVLCVTYTTTITFVHGHQRIPSKARSLDNTGGATEIGRPGHQGYSDGDDTNEHTKGQNWPVRLHGWK